MDLAKLKRCIKGKVILPTHSQYTENCQLFNRAVHHTPAMFVKVRQANDICYALEYARKNKLPVSVRGGGHSSSGSCLISDGLIIDTRALTDMKINVQTRQLSVGPGVLNRDVDKIAHDNDLVLPQGTCPTVGVVGSTMGGGVGFLSKKFGLMCDHVEHFTMINAAGEFLDIDHEQHSDLFWALRGAGANQFGVVTQVAYRAHSMPKLIYGGTISWPLKAGKEILQRYRDLMASAEDELCLYAFIPHAPKVDAVISLFGFYFEDNEKSEKLFDAMQSWHPPVHSDLSLRPYMDLQSAHYEEELAVDWKHGFIPGQLCDDLIDIVVDSFYRCPENCGGIMLDPLGGAINRVDKSATAFIHRDSQYICSITGLYNGDFMPQSVKDWVRESYQLMQPYFGAQAYQNYEDPELNEVQCYYGEHVQRLKQLKAKYDPEGLFCGSLTRGKL